MSQPFALDQAAETDPVKIKIPPLPVRIVQVFTAPATLFDSLRERPVWIGALLLMIGIGLSTQFLIPDEVLRTINENFIRGFMPAGTDPDVLREAVDAAMDRPFWQTAIGSVAGTPVMLAVISGLLLLAFNVVMGGEAKFRQLFSATVHAFYIYSLGGFVVLGLMFMGSEQMVLSPGLFLPDMGEGFLSRFLNGINVFSVWTCVTLGIAVSRIYPKRGVAGGTIYLLTLYLLVIGTIAGLSGLMG